MSAAALRGPARVGGGRLQQQQGWGQPTRGRPHPRSPLPRVPLPPPPPPAGSKEFKKYAEAWETTVLALIGEQVDPDNFVNGVYLQDKHARNTTALRLDVWFSTDDDQVRGCPGVG